MKPEEVRDLIEQVLDERVWADPNEVDDLKRLGELLTEAVYRINTALGVLADAAEIPEGSEVDAERASIGSLIEHASLFGGGRPDLGSILGGD